MRQTIAALALSLSLALGAAAPAGADTALSAEIGAKGLQPVIDPLQAMPAPGDGDRFALGGLIFLRTVEKALQARWKVGLSRELQAVAMIPLLRLPVPENPNPEPFRPELIAAIFAEAGAGMKAARAQLAQIPPGSDFGVEISLGDLWFDIDANGRRDPGEGMAEVAGPMLMGWRWGQRDPGQPLPVIRFDAADAAWLSAYTHLISGVSEAVQAYDPTAAIARVLEARTAMARLGPPSSPDYGIGATADAIAAVLGALNQPPDAAHAAAARSELLAMIADNRRFWSEVAKETDDNREWIPNDSQKSALGIAFPKGLGPAWLAVLDDAEAMLNGKLLIPYWRAGSAGGVNAMTLFTEPRPVDLVGWIQGWAAVPYLEEGKQIGSGALARFTRLVSGRSALFMVMLN